jgi:hypothetical protein
VIRNGVPSHSDVVGDTEEEHHVPSERWVGPRTRPEPGWPVGATTSVNRSFTGAGYAVSPRDRRYADYVTAPAPKSTFISDAMVTATAAVQVTVTGFQDGTGWKHLDGIDVTQPVTISAECADVPDAPVELTMGVNGKRV